MFVRLSVILLRVETLYHACLCFCCAWRRCIMPACASAARGDAVSCLTLLLLRMMTLYHACLCFCCAWRRCIMPACASAARGDAVSCLSLLLLRMETLYHACLCPYTEHTAFRSTHGYFWKTENRVFTIPFRTQFSMIKQAHVLYISRVSLCINFLYSKRCYSFIWFVICSFTNSSIFTFFCILDSSFIIPPPLLPSRLYSWIEFFTHTWVLFAYSSPILRARSLGRLQHFFLSNSHCLRYCPLSHTSKLTLLLLVLLLLLLLLLLLYLLLLFNIASLFLWHTISLRLLFS
jgi:hypothetical protein